MGWERHYEACAVPEFALRLNLHDLDLGEGVTIVHRAKQMLFDALTGPVEAVKPIFGHKPGAPSARNGPTRGLLLAEPVRPANESPAKCRFLQPSYKR
jgi:hypothetical protein